LGRAVLAIPAPIANAMLAGVLLEFCLAPFKAISEVPALALPVVIVWAVTLRFARLYAAPAAVAAAVIMFILSLSGIVPGVGAVAGAGASGTDFWPHPVWITPVFSWQAMVSIALPLFLVTMASQNIPGFTVLRSNGYEPPTTPLLVGTGIASVLSAPFGGHAVNLAAITAAICAGPDAHPDTSRRYIAAVSSGIAYVIMGVLAPIAVGFISASPPVLIEAVAGLALLARARHWARVQSQKPRMLAMLFGGFVWLGLALTLAAVSHGLEAAGAGTLGLAPLHAYTMGFLGSTMLAMVGRIAAGHGGRAVAADGWLWALFGLLQGTVLVRLAAAAGAPDGAGIALAAVMWALVALGWGGRMLGWFLRPRPDGRPG